MLLNYIRLTFRNLLKYKSYSLINIFGLSLGFAVFLLLWAYITHERSIDQFYPSNLYRVVSYLDDPDIGMRRYAVSPNAAAKALASEFPEVERTGRMMYLGQTSLKKGENLMMMRNYIYADSSAVSMLDLNIVSGTSSGLYDDNEMLISKSAAKTFFGEENPVNQVIEQNRTSGGMKVLGVFEDFPDNSTYDFDVIYLGEFDNWNERWQPWLNSWEEIGMTTLVELKPGTSPQQILAKKDQVLATQLDGLKQPYDFDFQALNDMHLYSGEFEEMGMEPMVKTTYGDANQLFLFISIAILVIAIASFNYMNLSLARSLKRLKEVGVRKVSGATKANLRIQFFSESVLMTIIAFAIAILLAEAFLPSFNVISGKSFSSREILQPQYLLITLLLSIMTGIVSGILPASVFASFSPMSIFGKQRNSKGIGKVSFRKLFVVFQFVISITLIISTLVIYRQMDYIQNKDLGFEKDRKLVIDINSGNTRRSFKTIKTELLSHPSIKSVSSTSRVPGEWKNIPTIRVSHQDFQNVEMRFMGWDKDALSTFGFKIIEGSNFSGNDQVDSLNVLVNETLVQQMGWEEPIGKKIRYAESEESHSATVIGVVKDFHFESLYTPVSPLLIGNWNNPIQSIDYFTVLYNGSADEVLAHASSIHSRFDEFNPIEYHFLDEQLNRFYEVDENRVNVLMMAAILSIIIATLGLFGLVSYTTEARTKEFGIRKTLGALYPTACAINCERIPGTDDHCIYGFCPLDYLFLIRLAR